MRQQVTGGVFSLCLHYIVIAVSIRMRQYRHANCLQVTVHALITMQSEPFDIQGVCRMSALRGVCTVLCYVCMCV